MSRMMCHLPSFLATTVTYLPGAVAGPEMDPVVVELELGGLLPVICPERPV
jgi:hypothetical protein